MEERENVGEGINRRKFLEKMTLTAGGMFLGSFTFANAQQRIEPGKPIPPLVLEHYADQMRVEACRVYAQELAKIGIRVELKPLVFGAFMGKIYVRHELTLAMGGFGGSEERLDPDWYLRSCFHSKGAYNISGYNNPEYDKVVDAQERELDPTKRKQLINQAQRIYAKDLPSWWITGRSLINPVNTRLFTNVRPAKATGLETFLMAPFMELEPKTSLREVNLATFARMSSAHLFTERSTNGQGFLRFVYDTFLRHDGNLNLIPWAAESYKVVDPTTVDLKIRDGMKWHDGKPVTGEDAKFTFDYLLKWKPALWQNLLSPVKGAELINPSTLRVRLAAPSATFFTITLTHVTILPAHIWKDIPERAGVKDPGEWNMAKHGAIGSGPFKFVSFEKDVDCYIKANHDHWTGGPKIDGIHYIQASSVDQLKGGMETENIHIVGDGLTLEDGKKLEEKPYIKLYVVPHHSVVTFFVDMRRPPLQDWAFRYALYYGCPKQKILETALAGGGDVARRSPLPPVFTDMIPAELGGDEFSLDKAKKALLDAGYSWKDGLLLMKKA